MYYNCKGDCAYANGFHALERTSAANESVSLGGRALVSSDVLLTVHLSIILAINQLNAKNLLL